LGGSRCQQTSDPVPVSLRVRRARDGQSREGSLWNVQLDSVVF